MRIETHNLWDLADSLGLSLDVNKNDIITGTAVKLVTLGDLKIPVPLKIVSSKAVRKMPLVICRSLGNLGFLATTGYKAGATTTLWVLDLAKMGKPEGFLEVRTVAHVDDVVRELTPAIVEQFDKDKQYRWHRVV